MSGTSAGAARRARCPSCGMFQHKAEECPDLGPRKTLPAEVKRANANAYARKWRAANADKRNAAANRSNAKVKRRVMEHYGPDGVAACCCCGADHMVFLTLDHIDGAGAERRRATGTSGGVHYYRILIREGFPDGYRVLCWNCNSAFGILGYCPHNPPADKPLVATEHVYNVAR